MGRLIAVIKLDNQQLASLIMLGLTAIVLVGFQQKSLGWYMYGLAIFFTVIGTKNMFRNHILLLFVSLGFLGLIPITTEITNENFARMGAILLAALLLPYYVSRKFLNDKTIQYRLINGRWSNRQILYLVFTLVASYFLIPFYLESTGSWMNWSVENTKESIGRLFIGTNALGIWDELFFVSTVLGILRKYLPFIAANGLQAILFTSFLYELGFRGWGPLVIYPFALLQGYIFMKTDSLLYVIAIHLIIDFVLFLSLINLHHPQLADWFI